MGPVLSLCIKRRTLAVAMGLARKICLAKPAIHHTIQPRRDITGNGRSDVSQARKGAAKHLRLGGMQLLRAKGLNDGIDGVVDGVQDVGALVRDEHSAPPANRGLDAGGCEYLGVESCGDQM